MPVVCSFDQVMMMLARLARMSFLIITICEPWSDGDVGYCGWKQ